MVLVEAMAFGTPAVSTDCPGGPSFLLDRGRFGELVPMEDPRAMSAAIAGVVTDGARRDSFIGLGPQRAREFAPTRIAERYLELARECVAGRSGKAG
jgi:glycosyltransferase involved in cell wall biosynthesis